MSRLLTFAASAAVAFAVLRGAAVAAPKAQVMIVGVSHLVARHDVHNSVYTDNPLSAKRQAQIDEIVSGLARFHPTKVLIEAPFGSRKIADQYRAYLARRFHLGANEIYQYGFKLAARSGNAAIYPMDTWGPSIYDDNAASGKVIDTYLETHFSTIPDALADEFIAHEHYIQLHGTYLDELRYINSDHAIKASASWYSVLDGMGRESHDAGATYVAQWYTRNCFIFSNILSISRPGDRVVVLMGQGHEYLLREFVRLNPNLVYVAPLPYLTSRGQTANRMKRPTTVNARSTARR